jgi:hypothetical protein
LLNAAYQDGSDASPYPRWLGTAIRVASILLLPVALLAIYALGVRIEGYGLTASRGWGFLVALVALGYAGGYAWAAARRGAWMAGMGAVNVAVALFTIVAMTLMLTPLLSPERLAAASQYRRVLADPETDAYADLRFRTGRYGRERLAALAAIEGHARTGDIRGRAREELSRSLPWSGPTPPGGLGPGNLVAYPSGTPIGPALIEAFNAYGDPQLMSYCTPQARCPVLFTDLNRDGAAEAILFARHGIVGATPAGDGWQLLDRLVQAGASASSNDRETLVEALEDGRYRIGELPWQPVEINGELYLFAEPAPRDGTCAEEAEDVSCAPATNRESP